MEHDVEGSVVEGTEAGHGPRSPSPGALVASVIKPLDVRETKQAMQTYQEGLRSLLEDGDWQKTGDGEFVKKSGWRKIATWFGLSVQLVSQRVERDEAGEPLRASVIARAQAPNGRYMEGDGHCAANEGRFRSDKGRQKLENDLIATATTRAKNRAIADLVGMGAVSAEEVEGTTVRPRGPEFGEEASDDLQEKLVKALRVFVGDEKIVPAIEKLAADAGGYLPRITARAVCLVLAERLGTAERDAQRETQDEKVEAVDVQEGDVEELAESEQEGVTDGSDGDEAEGAPAGAGGGTGGADAA
jgi:hypothetical protein